MVYNLIIDALADKETEAAVAYYDAIDLKLGTRFLSELSICYKKLSANPQLYSFVSSNHKSPIRDIKLKSFPYLVIYEIRQNYVMIISIQNRYKKPFIA